MEIIRLKGTEKKLYELVAPLVMNPAIIRQNNGYPFKTSKDYTWYLALEEDEITGFMPVKKTDEGALIDNYYTRGDDELTLNSLLKSATIDSSKDGTLRATVLKRHVAVFRAMGYLTSIEWKNYDKMIYAGPKQTNDNETA